ncbi:MAG: glycoside hydrolase family 43 protein [Lachnospiraceae bacterium]|nr:glycoside hydrolase family 43 protein [Lachnospiraceae bacterium]
MKKKHFGKRVSITLAGALLAAACVLGGCGKDAGGNSSEGSGVSEERAPGFVITENDVTVSLSTDKDVYEAGEQVEFTLTIENNRADAMMVSRVITYMNTGGLVAAEGTRLPVSIPQLKSGASVTLTGTLMVDETVPESSAGTSSGAGATFNGSLMTTIRPFVRIDYAGEEKMVRMMLPLELVEVARQIPEEHRNIPTFVSVHDPSVFKGADGRYYLFGTHITAASSDDLFDWKDETAMFRDALPEDTISALRTWHIDKARGEWNGNLWAPDIIYNTTMKKYCIYLSANGDQWKSNIVLLTADEMTGPYEYAGSVVYGGFNADTVSETDVLKVLGTTELPERYLTYGADNKRWGDQYPNCIDPCVFYDEEGNLWMSYGSWSGGIFLLALDEETGLRDYAVSYETGDHEDAYFGKKIAGGWYVTGEGSYIQYIGDYYYLFMSYGGLEAKGGYNIRIFRSENPDGPYVDELGNSPLFDKYILNVNMSVGVRLFGNYRWGTMSQGQVAQGHNSAFVDDDGRAYIIYHTRTTDGTEGHHVEVHQLFLNEDGWLVAAPYRTDGESIKTDGYEASAVAGDYEVITHTLNVNYSKLEVNRPQSITLNGDGSITGAMEGSWSLVSETPYIHITLGEEEYHGVTVMMEEEGSDINTMTFTALGEETQITIWGSKVTDQE